MSFNKQLNWAVLGTGVIANEMAQALQNMGKKLYAVGNRTHSKAIDFAKKYGIEKVYDDFQDIFTDPDVDIIYLTTPHNTHYPFMKKALENHKHLFVEKSITLNSRELNECVKLAQENNLILERKKNNPSKNVDKDTKSEINELITSITSKIKDNKKLSDKDIDSFIEQLNNLIQTIKSEKSKIIDRMKQTIEAEIEKYKKELDRLNSIN